MSTEFYSIYGQLDALAAEDMIKKGKAKRLPDEAIPEDQRKSADGRPLRFAISIKKRDVPEFEQLIRDYYL